jgi:AcrR family transcriptional regulator
MEKGPAYGSPAEAIPGPARPLGRRAEAAVRREQIVREAMRCFADKGFRGTTTRELAARIGITEAALYHYFPSKEALYGAIIDSKMAAPTLAEVLAEPARRGDDRAVFGTLARIVLERGQADPDFMRILTFTALEGHELAGPFFEARVRTLLEFLAGYVERRIAEGAFRRVDPALAARAFLGMVFDHLSVRSVFNQVSAHSIEEVVDTYVSIFLGGMQERETHRPGEKTDVGR